jgi:hypothetical protein
MITLLQIAALRYCESPALSIEICFIFGCIQIMCNLVCKVSELRNEKSILVRTKDQMEETMQG